MRKVKVEFRRVYAAGKTWYRPGQTAEVDEALARRLESTRPPFAVRIEEPKPEKTEAPKAKDAAGN